MRATSLSFCFVLPDTILLCHATRLSSFTMGFVRMTLSNAMKTQIIHGFDLFNISLAENF